MPPIMSASEREVPVVGRSYSPAFLGWLSAMRSSLTWNSRSSSATLGIPDCCVCHPGFWISLSTRQLLCQTLLLSLIQQTLICPLERSGGRGKVPGKLQCTTGCDAPYLRMMGSNSHCESRRDRSQSDMREQRACGSPACVLGSGDPAHLDCTRGSATFHAHVLCHDRGLTGVVNMDKADDEITEE